ncbi:MAG TPA: ABC transporter permease [Thermoanaerobaculia bacterium]|nr:ABC transporter permease [Thermoanaerobaculia bacterium]
MRSLLQDLRYAGRLLARSPGFTLLTVLTLALGIGANTAIFSVVDGVLLTPLPYRQPDRLMAVYSQFPGLGFDKFWVSAPEYLEFRRWNSSFQDVGAYTAGEVNVGGKDQPLRVRAAAATATLFSTLAVAPELGRAFTEAEDLPNTEKTVILGHGLWKRAFGGDRGVLGTRVIIDGEPRTVVGVMPPSFDVGSQRIEAWVPLALNPVSPGNRGGHYLYLVGRLKPGATLASSRLDLGGLLARWKREFPATHSPDPERHRLVIKPLLEDLVGDVRSRVVVLAVAVGLVLLIACLNVANLLLARAEGRQREIAIRTALGAARGRLLRQFLTESVLLALCGGGLGLLLAVWGVKAIVALNAASIPRVEAIGVDARAVAFTLAVSLVTGLLFGLAPAIHVRGAAFFGSLKEGTARSTAGVVSQWFRRALVVVEITLATLLVIGAGLLLKSFWMLQEVNPGFDPKGVLTFRVALPDATYPEDPKVIAFWRDLTARLSALPGVEGAAAMSGLPPKRDVNANDTDFEGLPAPPVGPIQNVDYWQFVTRDYFRTMKIPLVEGRLFEPTDAAGSPGVAIVNQTLAKTFWPHQSAIGRRLRAPGPDDNPPPWLTVVGVVADVKQGGLDQKTGTELYFLQDQTAEAVGGSADTMNLVVRTERDPLTLADMVRQEVRRMDPALPLAGMRPMSEVLFESIASPRLLMVLVMLFAAVALVLAAIGTYGVLSYAVEQRTREIGIRMALGAQVGQVLRMILSQGAVLAGIGLALGVVGALALQRVLASLLFGTAPTDPLIFGLVVALLAAVSLLACWWPARRAARVDPLVALRYE